MPRDLRIAGLLEGLAAAGRAGLPAPPASLAD